MQLSITWLGHSTFAFDPRLESACRSLALLNPSCRVKKPPKVDADSGSHGHFDHLGRSWRWARESNAPVVAMFELCDWLGRKGSELLADEQGRLAERRPADDDDRRASQRGYVDNGQMVYMGEPAGYVVRLEDGRDLFRRRHVSLRRHAADRRDVRPEIAFLPIGDHYTMGPIGRRRHASSSASAGRADAGARSRCSPARRRCSSGARVTGVEVLELKPGETTGKTGGSGFRQRLRIRRWSRGFYSVRRAV